MSIFFYETKIGKIGIAEKDGKISNLFFETDKIPDGLQTAETSVLREASEQLREYLAGKRKVFSLPLAPEGTDFMKRVWTSLCDIPFGKAASYREIAERAGNPKAYRAVGLANHRNPVPIFIPCHRVIGTDGSLTGYRGGIELKKKLLDLERNI